MALAQFYDLTATEESENHGDLINPYHQRAFYYHQADTTWYELDLAAFVKRYSDLNEDYFTDQVTIRNRDQLFQVTSDYGGVNAMEQELYQLKVSLGSVPDFKPPTLNEALAADQVKAIPRELLDDLVQIWYHESTLDQLTAELDQFQDTVMELQQNRSDQIKIVAILAKYKDRFEQLLTRFDENLGLDDDIFCQLDTDDTDNDPESQLCALSDQE